jgi:hypothetical protein
VPDGSALLALDGLLDDLDGSVTIVTAFESATPGRPSLPRR